MRTTEQAYNSTLAQILKNDKNIFDIFKMN